MSEPSSLGPSSLGELPREQRLRDRLAVRLAAEIVSGRLRPDDAFPSAEDIVQQYGVSRTVAREALQTLTMVGFVRSQQGKRTEIMPRESWNVLSSVVQEALRGAGIDYDKVVAAQGSPFPFLRKGSRDELQAATGSKKLPALKLADGTVITNSRAILAWVKQQG